MNLNKKYNFFRRLILSGIMLTITSMTFSQTKTISGLVTSSEDGQPLIGATVLEKSSKNGTITNIEGNYTIKNLNDNATLVFSMIGMKKI